MGQIRAKLQNIQTDKFHFRLSVYHKLIKVTVKEGLTPKEYRQGA